MDVPETVRRFLSASSSTSGAKCIPMLLLDNSSALRAKGETTADKALACYMAYRFVGERSRMNVHGYASILRDLRAPPPWVTVEMEDCLGNISDERRTRLRPLVEQVCENTDDTILERFRAYQREKWTVLKAVLQSNLEVEQEACKFEEELFREKIALARLLGVKLAGRLYQAVFDEFDGIYASGER